MASENARAGSGAGGSLSAWTLPDPSPPAESAFQGELLGIHLYS